MSVQPDTATSDSHLNEDNTSEKNGGKNELELQTNSNTRNKYPVVRIPLTGLAGKTVLQAWLRLTQYSTSGPTTIDTRVHALTESWLEPQVSWDHRWNGITWATAGGSRSPMWSDRVIAGAGFNGSELAWQVGPIVQAWQSGALANNGLVIVPDRQGPQRNALFRSSDQGNASERPRLVVYYTDEAPAIRDGRAEVQPRAAQIGATNSPISVLADVDALGATPSGLATGFDVLTLVHRGALAITAVDRMWIGGVPVPTTGVTWIDGGSSVTIRFPRVRISGRVRVDLRASVVGSVTPGGVDMPVLLDDSSTPGAWAQALWAGDADGTPGNGDDWILTLTSSPTVLLDLTPNTASILQGTCMNFRFFGEDASSNRYAVTPDSVRVTPSTAGTMAIDGTFCALLPGAARVHAWYGIRRDSSTVNILPALTPSFGPPVLRNRAGVVVNTMTPGDTMLAEIVVSEGNGFQDIQDIRFSLFHSGYASASNEPAFNVAIRWRRGDPSPWKTVDPISSTWTVIPSLCQIDTTTNATSPQLMRVAYVVGRIARASSTGNWNIAARVFSATPPDTSSSGLSGVDMAPVLTFALSDYSARFSPATAGTTRLPLSQPTSGAVELRIWANDVAQVAGRAEDLIGAIVPSDTLFVRRAAQPLAWALDASGLGGGSLDTVSTTLLLLPAPTSESVVTRSLHLWSDYPGTSGSQDYHGPLRLTASLPASSTSAPEHSVLLTASIVGGGLAARSADAEVKPSIATAGASTVFDAYVMPEVVGTDTGIDWLRVTLPLGYGVPTISSVRVGGASVAFADSSRPDAVIAALATNVQNGQLIRIRFTSIAPTAADATGAKFSVTFDDTGTSLPPQSADEGDANLVADGDSWVVRVAPGPVATMLVVPASLDCPVDSTVQFNSSAWDEYGNPAPPAATWATSPSIGTITASGQFTATTRGIGTVTGRSGSAADSVAVHVHPRPGIIVRSVTGPASLVPGQSIATFEVQLANPSDQDIRLDSLTLVFSRIARGDADAYFTVIGAPALPMVLSADGSASLQIAVRTSLSIPSNWVVFVDAAARAATLSLGIAVRDDDSDNRHALSIGSSDLVVTATQTGGAILPGDSAAVSRIRMLNRNPDPRTLRRLRLTNRTTGPGTQAQLDQALGAMSLYVDDGDGLFGPGDVRLARAVAVAGIATFDSLSIPLTPFEWASLHVVAYAPLAARDGDVLDLRIEASSSLLIEPATTFGNAWPVDPIGGTPIDGMAAAQIGLEPVLARGVNPSAVDQLVLQAVFPANGYEADILQGLSVMNIGSARNGVEISRVRAWVDNGDASFNSTSDRLLGTLAFTGDRWVVSGLSESIPTTGKRVFVSADLAPLATQGTTLQFSFPFGAVPGMSMASANDGPCDRSVTNPFAQIVTDSDRITFEAIPLPPTSAAPGDRDLVVLQLRALNTYASARTLEMLTVANSTTGPGSTTQLDREIRQLVLREDGDDDGVLDATDVDPVIDSGFYTNGRVVFSGLRINLPALSSQQVFVTVELSRTAAADGDIVAAQLVGPEDVALGEPSTVAGNWPLDSGARVAIDGFVSSQLAIFPTPSATVSPGDGPLLALDFVIPANGYRSDELQGVRVRNVGTASSSDVAFMQLWLDGGDGALTPGTGDEVLLGSMTPVGGSWQSPLLSQAVSGAGARLFVSVQISPSASDSVGVDLQIPRDGIVFTSGNDGPNDLDVNGPGALLISTSPLLATLAITEASTVGQTLPLRLILRNVGPETIRDIAPGTLQMSVSGALSVSTGPSPSLVTLAPGAVDTVTWSCLAMAPGVVLLDVDASGLGDSSGLIRTALRTSSGSHRLYLASSDLEMVSAQTMPVNVNRGQSEVIPFSLTLTNPGAVGSSDVRVQSLRIRLEDDAGDPIIPSTLLQRVTVSEGTSVYLVKSILETSGSEISLPLATFAQITQSDPTTLALRLDVLPSTTIPSFRVILDDSLSIQAQDITSLAPVRVQVPGTGYPVRSDLARVVLEATRADATALPSDTVRASRGATAVPLLLVRIENPGVSGISSDVRLSAMGLEVIDASTGSRVPPHSLLSTLRVRTGAQIHLTRALVPADSTALTLSFSPPINLPANTPMDVRIEADVRSLAPLGRYRARLVSPMSLQARDATTRSTLPVFFPQDSVAGAPVQLEADAETLLVAQTPLLAPRLLVGQPAAQAFQMTIRHTGTPGTSRIRVDSLSIACRNEARIPLASASVLSRMRLRWNGTPISVVTAMPSGTGTFTVPLPSMMLEPGETATLNADVDIHAAAPTGLIELSVAAAGIHVSDANSGSPVLAVAYPGSELPVLSGLGRIESPARLLAVGLDSRMPTVIAADGTSVSAGLIVLSNVDSTAAGAILLDHLRVRASDRAYSQVNIGALASRIEAHVDGTLWAQSATLSVDSVTATLVASSTLAIDVVAARNVELRFIPRGGASASGVRLGCDRADIGVVQPASALLTVAIQPRAGSAFPLWTSAGGFSPVDLKSSYANFPNPFAAGREDTRVAYYLRGAARVTLQIVSARGEDVITLLDDVAKPPGLHQSDVWNGRNGRGDTVHNGIYVARLRVRYDDGTSESVVRKMAVVR